MRKPIMSNARETPSTRHLPVNVSMPIAQRLIRQSHVDNQATPEDWTRERLERLCVLWNVELGIISAMLNCTVADFSTDPNKRKKMSGPIALMLSMMERQGHERQGNPAAKPFVPVGPSDERNHSIPGHIRFCDWRRKKLRELTKKKRLATHPESSHHLSRRTVRRHSTKARPVVVWQGECAI